MKNKKQTLSAAILGIIVGVAISMSVTVSAFKQDKTLLPVQEIRKFNEVMALIKSDYVEEVNEKELITDAIRGMLSGLDPHSAYLDSEEFAELQVDTSGKFGGLGIEVGMENGFVKVISPIDDTPAAKAGIKAGDLIIRLDEEQVKGKTLNEAVNIMRGEPGEPIILTVVREGEAAPIEIKITRAIITVKSVKQKLLEANYGYLRISSFQADTSSSAKQAIRTLEKNNNGKLKGLILDLRNNPGGVLGAAVGVSDLFLTEGRIVNTEGRVADSEMDYDATNFDLMEGKPIIVLVNQGSASASEIVSGALQDHDRALILGEKTFGKGSVQSVLPIDRTTAVKLTTARYFTPSGRSIQAKGIIPDIEVEQREFSDKKKESSPFEAVSEADLNGHLSNLEKDKKSDSKKETLTSKVKTTEDDYQLFEALNILKGMSLYQSKLAK